MVFWQLTIDANDPARLCAFWKEVLGWETVPPTEPDTTWWRHYRGRADEDGGFYDRLFDPEGLRPPLWFQEVPETKSGKNRLHVDVYVTARDDDLPLDERIALVDARVASLVALGATVVGGARSDDPSDPYVFVTLQDPEGNEFCVS